MLSCKVSRLYNYYKFIVTFVTFSGFVQQDRTQYSFLSILFISKPSIDQSLDYRLQNQGIEGLLQGINEHNLSFYLCLPNYSLYS